MDCICSESTHKTEISEKFRLSHSNKMPDFQNKFRPVARAISATTTIAAAATSSASASSSLGTLLCAVTGEMAGLKRSKKISSASKLPETIKKRFRPTVPGRSWSSFLRHLHRNDHRHSLHRRHRLRRRRHQCSPWKGWEENLSKTINENEILEKNLGSREIPGDVAGFPAFVTAAIKQKKNSHGLFAQFIP